MQLLIDIASYLVSMNVVLVGTLTQHIGLLGAGPCSFWSICSKGWEEEITSFSASDNFPSAICGL